MGTSALDILDIGEELSEDADVTGAYGGAAFLLAGSSDGCRAPIPSLPLMLSYRTSLREDQHLGGAAPELAV